MRQGSRFEPISDTVFALILGTKLSAVYLRKAIAGMVKFYAVACGRRIGVFSDWDQCRNQVHKYSGARYKAFSTEQEALAFLRSETGDFNGIPIGSEPSGSLYLSNGNPNMDSVDKNSEHIGGCADGDFEITVIYTDGSSINNGREGARAGWGVYWGPNDPRNQKGRVTTGEQTNNRGELLAINKAVSAIDKEAKSGSRYEIRADSEYAINSIGKWGENWQQNGWKTSSGQPVKNQDLIESARDKIKRLANRDVEVKITHVPAHVGHHGNECADWLARSAAIGI